MPLKRMETYKPLLFTTTVRNPERLKDFLTVLSQYDSEILTNEIMYSVSKECIKRGLYRPMIVSDGVKKKWKLQIELDNAEVETVFEENPQSHKEAGFDRGWASRFATWFDLAKELGFAYFWVGERIEFSESGYMLLDRERPENEQMVFANAFAKYQRQNPFVRVRNRNVPLILLIDVIQLLNDDPDYNGAGISRKEIPLLLCWRDDDAEALYHLIKDLRHKHGFAPSDETILELCEELIENNGKVTRMNNNSILVDYPDDFIRKMRLTGLISIRGGGRFIGINTKEIAGVNYILENYSTDEEFQDEKAFFQYIGTVDKDLIATLTIYAAPTLATANELQRWAQYYKWNDIKAELLGLTRSKYSSKDPILKVVENPLRLEFLTSLAIISKLPNVTVKPNYTSDDQGLPVSFAPGGNPDIECHERKDTILIEVTLLTGTQQHIRESQSVRRHLEDYTVKGIDAFSIFVSPKAFVDTCRNAEFIKFQYGLDVKILDIDLFVEQLETNSTLKEAAFTASSCDHI